MNFLRPLLIALQFLTRLPITLRELPNERETGLSMLFYPCVGLLIGGLLAALGMAATYAHAPTALCAALLVALWVGLTGGLHLDGLADSVDGWIGGQGRPERILEIMKDPCCGPMGVSVLVLVLLLKFVAVQALLENGGVAGLLLAPLLGRMALPLLFFSTPYVRRGGLGSILASHFPRRQSVVVVLLFSLTILVAYTWNGALAVGAAMGAFTLLRRTMRQTIGGTTGDTAGALVEVVEVTVVVALGLFSGA